MPQPLAVIPLTEHPESTTILGHASRHIRDPQQGQSHRHRVCLCHRAVILDDEACPLFTPSLMHASPRVLLYVTTLDDGTPLAFCVSVSSHMRGSGS